MDIHLIYPSHTYSCITNASHKNMYQKIVKIFYARHTIIKKNFYEKDFLDHISNMYLLLYLEIFFIDK